MNFSLDSAAKWGAIFGGLSTFVLAIIAAITVRDVYENLQLQKQNRELISEIETHKKTTEATSKELSEVQKRLISTRTDLEQASNTLTATRNENTKLQETNLALIKANTTSAEEQSEALKLIRETTERLNIERNQLANLQQELARTTAAKIETERSAHRYFIRQFIAKIKHEVIIGFGTVKFSGFETPIELFAMSGIYSQPYKFFAKGYPKRTLREMLTQHFGDSEFDVLAPEARDRFKKRIMNLISKHSDLLDANLGTELDSETVEKLIKKRMSGEKEEQQSEELKKYEADNRRREVLKGKVIGALDQLERELLDSII